jgi:hypothetical protein
MCGAQALRSKIEEARARKAGSLPPASEPPIEGQGNGSLYQATPAAFTTRVQGFDPRRALGVPALNGPGKGRFSTFLGR